MAELLTSGKVPLEKTLLTPLLAAEKHTQGADGRNECLRDYVHEQTSLSTSAVTDNNQLSADLSHGILRRWCVWGC